VVLRLQYISFSFSLLLLQKGESFWYTQSMDLLTTREAATLCGASIWTVRYWIKHGRLPAYRREGRWLIHRDDVARLLQAKQ
jgi:excisionase family DNA binding protein